MTSVVKSARRARAIILPCKHLFLLSHMRAYTSLFGHILGSNPAICGYYEMHIGYHSWKSLVRQKLLYFEEEDAKPGLEYMFDKVLHNDHNVSTDILNMRRSRTIFALRPPGEVIPSILRLYAKIDPQHEYNSEAFSTRYYVERLVELERLAGLLRQPYFYMDAAALKLDSARCLEALSQWLELGEPLSEHYDMQRNTSRERYGDSSERMRAGTITRDVSNFEDFTADPALMAEAVTAYQHTRAALLAGSTANTVLDTTVNDQPDGERL